ncbi:sensor histidine kinase [Methylocystis parvus]|uniref:sensor histidine kinase n=1 Tax=Methylocystis parvus TaxID=134 RepID=UPI003C71EF7A
MNCSTSLRLRLSLHLIIGQFLCFVAILTINHARGLIEDNALSLTTWNSLAEIRVRAAVNQSLAQAPDGSIFIEPNESLRSLMAKHPTIQFAAFDPETSAPLRGSSPELAKALRGHGDILTTEMALFKIRGLMEGQQSGRYHAEMTPFGLVLMATYGYVFEWQDFGYHLYNDILGILSYYGWSFVVAVAIGWLSLGSGLAPIDNVIRSVRKIDTWSLDQRIPREGIPTELAPLVDTINEALARLDAGVSRQRRFIANAAHELRTPLTILNARIESPEKPGFKDQLLRDVKRLRNIVEQLLAFGRHGRDNPAPRTKVDLVDLTQGVVDDHALLAIKCGKEIEFQSSALNQFVLADRSGIEGVLRNLIDNALRAEPNGGTVIVRVGPGPEINVEDHGEGVANEHRDKVFEPFWRKDAATPGAGLGLPIALEIMDAHGGRIVVAETLGGGATFRLSFAEEHVERGVLSDSPL